MEFADQLAGLVVCSIRVVRGVFCVLARCVRVVLALADEHVGGIRAFGIFDAVDGCDRFDILAFKTERGDELKIKEGVRRKVFVAGLGKGVLADLETGEKAHSKSDYGQNGEPAAKASFYLSQNDLGIILKLCTNHQNQKICIEDFIAKETL